ncbi:MAG: hypothetical protein V7641_2804 [Blastocatellia bacterium]
MLAEIEKKTAALLADALAARSHLSVTVAPGPPAPTVEGKEVAVVSITEVMPETAFNPERFIVQTSPAQTRRVLSVSFIAAIDFAIRAADTPAGLTAARTLLLDDLALSSHFLIGDKIRHGASFVVANPDPGFRVTGFAVVKNVFNRDPQQGLLTARIECRGQADIWPPGTAQPEGQIGAVDINVIPQPIDIVPLQPVVSTGGTLRLHVRGLPTRRGPGAPPGPFAVAVRVLSDVPPDQRGTIANGINGAESNLRIVNVSSPDTEVQYQAPAAGIDTMRIEIVTLYFATPERKPGAFLGAVPIQVRGGN